METVHTNDIHHIGNLKITQKHSDDQATNTLNELKNIQDKIK